MVTPFDLRYSDLPHRVNGIAEIRPFSGVMVQAGPGLVTVTTSYEALLEDGSVLHGATYYPHWLPFQRVELPSVQRLWVTSIEQELNGSLLRVRTMSHVSPMADVPVVVSVPAALAAATAG